MRLCAGFDARLFFLATLRKRDGLKKPDADNSQVLKPQLLRVAKSLRRFFLNLLLQLDVASWLLDGCCKLVARWMLQAGC
jgi:hypothetical protein